MPDETLPEAEPVLLVGAINTAIAVTLAFLGILLDWSADVLAGITAVFGAWVGVVSIIVRTKVMPTKRVAVTTDGTVVNSVNPA
jgi:hypothetical protein